MAFLIRVFSRSREVPRHAEEIREEFRLRKHEVSRELLQNAEVRGLVEMIFDNSDQQSKLFLLSPSQSSLKENEDVVSRILSGLALQNASLFGRLSGAVEQYGVETVSDVVVHVLKLLSNSLVGKHSEFEDDLPESLDFGWQLSSPLSGKPKFQFNTRQQSINRQELQAAFPFQDDDGIKKITHQMEEAPQFSSNNTDKVWEQEQEADDLEKKDQNIPASPVEEFAFLAHPAQVQASPGKQEEVFESSDGDTGFQTIMRVAASTHDGGATGNRVNQGEPAESRASSVNNSRRLSYAGSELYTTDSDDDDSLSTCSHTSLLVAVSEEGHDDSGASSSGDGDGLDVLILEPESMEVVDVVCDSTFGGGDQPSDDCNKPAEIPFPSEDLSLEKCDLDAGDDSAEEKLPICSSVVLSRKNSCSEDDMSQESFYVPEMWTYSADKDANEFEAALSRGVEDNHIILKSLQEEVVEDVKVVRVVMKSTTEDEHVFVSVHPVPETKVTDSLIDDSGLDNEELAEQEKTLDIDVIALEKHSQAEDDDPEKQEEDDPEAHLTVDILEVDHAENTEVVQDTEDTEEATPGDGKPGENVYGDSPEKLTEESSEAATGAADSDEERGESEPSTFESSDEEDTEEVAAEGNSGAGVDGTEGLSAAAEANSIGKLAEESLTRDAADGKLTDESEAATSTSTRLSDIIVLDTGRSETAAESATIQSSEHSKSADGVGPESLLFVPHHTAVSSPVVYNAHSGPIPYSGSLSLRSDSSTTSTRSFAFPILSAEWTSSPVKMPLPERVYPRHRRLSWRSLCCCSYLK